MSRHLRSAGQFCCCFPRRVLSLLLVSFHFIYFIILFYHFISLFCFIILFISFILHFFQVLQHLPQARAGAEEAGLVANASRADFAFEAISQREVGFYFLFNLFLIHLIHLFHLICI